MSGGAPVPSARPGETWVYEFGPFCLDPARAMLLRDGEPIPLPPKAFDTLALLVERGGCLVTKQELMHAVWPHTFVAPGNLAVTVHALRKALGQPEGSSYVETVPRRGYRLRALVRIRHEDGGSARLFPSPAAAARPETSTRGPAGGGEPPGEMAGDVGWGARLVSSRTRPIMTISIVLGLVVLAAVAVSYVMVGSPPASSSREDTLRITRITGTSRVQDAAISPDGAFAVYAAQTPSGNALRLLHLPTQSEHEILAPTSDAYQGLTFSPDGRHVYYRQPSGRGAWGGAVYRLPMVGGTPQRVVDGAATPPTFSPGGRQLAFVRRTQPDRDTLVVADIDGSNPRALAAAGRAEYLYTTAPAWSPDGERIALRARREDQHVAIVLVSVADGVERQLGEESWDNVEDLVWLPDGQGLLVAARDAWEQPHQLWRVSFPDGDRARLTHGVSNYHNVRITADGGTLLAIQGDRVANVFVAEADALGEPTPLTSGANAPHGVHGLTWTPDGHVVYASSSTTDTLDLWIAALDGSEPTRLTGGQSANAFPAIAPDGRSVVFVSDRGGPKQLWTMGIEGGPPRRLTDGVWDLYPDFTPDGQWIVYQRSRHRLWKASAAGADRMPLADGRAARPRVSPDGRIVACNVWNPVAERWRVALLAFESGQVLRTFDDIPSSPWAILRWTPDGQGLTYARRDHEAINLWVHPIDGSTPRQLTHFSSGHIHDFAWSDDGRYLAWAQGPLTTDLVLITGL